MPSSAEIIINGKFLSAPPTGVHRVAQELANAMSGLEIGLTGERTLPNLQVWIPHDGMTRAGAMHLPIRVKRPLRSIPWEQLTLPISAGNRLTLNLCNIGPILSRNAITMIHDAQVHITPDSYRRPFRLWYKFVQPIIAKRHRRILTVSEFSRGQLIAAGLGTPDKISVIHNGVDHILNVEPDPAILNRLALVERGFVVALASTQSHKNIGLLIEAFADSALSAIKLVLVGEAQAADFAGAGVALPSTVIFAGRVSDGELRALYEHALCLAFPSTTEGFGLPPMEAMRVGCPAIVAPCGALPEVCGQAALYADPNSPKAWIDSMLALEHDLELWARQSKAGIAHASQFTWRKAAERLFAILAAESAYRKVTRSYAAPARA